MALERFLRLSEERRTALLETTAEMFAAHGYEGTSYNELLRAIGMGKSQAYYYFNDKADLFITAIAAVYEDYYVLTRDLPEPTCKEGFWDQVELLHLMGFDFQTENPIAAKLTLAALQSPVRFQITDALLHEEGSTRDQHRYWVRLGQGLDAVRSDLPEELLVDMSVNQALFVDEWFGRHHLKSTRSQRKNLAVQMTEILERMFQPCSKPQKRR